MAKKILGMEIGNYRLKMAVCDEKGITEVVCQIPENLVREDEIVSWEAMAEFIKEQVKENHITCKNVAIVLPERYSYFKRVVLPPMTIDQLKVNLPYEFHDYITEDKEKYVYDYAVIDKSVDEEGNLKEMDLMAVAAPKEVIDNYKNMLKRAGLKLSLITPEFCSWGNIILNYEVEHNIGDDMDYAILDLGHRSIRMHFFAKGEYEITRNMEPGCNVLARVIAEQLSIDENIAQIYEEQNQDNILYDDNCMEIYSQMGVEIMRVINFYNFNHPETTLNKIYYCGGGAYIEPLLKEIRENIEYDLVKVTELLDSEAAEDQDLLLTPTAIGITMQ